MANDYFQFKKFTIQQDSCSMKVGTDGVLLGSWANVNNVNSILDIGTGTGLISLMLAQRNHSTKITAIEIESSASEQAQSNVDSSPFADRVRVHHIALQKFNSSIKFDLIISNPPFFIQEETYLSKDDRRNIARLSISLSYQELLEYATNNLSVDGRLALILPTNNLTSFIDLANERDLFVNRICHVYPTPTKDSKRVLLELSCIKKYKEKETLVLENSRHVYSKEAIALFKDFYLKL